MRSISRTAIVRKAIPICLVLAFLVVAFLANIYKAKWRGEEPWTTDNLLLVVSVFLAGVVVSSVCYYLSYAAKRRKESGKREKGDH